MESGSDKVVVIGAGMGGLATAMRLAHAGMGVTVIDSHASPGGKMRTVESDAGPVDAGPTVMTMRHVFDDLFAACGTALDDHVTLTSDRTLARHWWSDGSTLDLFADPEASARAVADFAGPAEAAAFRRFSDRARQLFDAFDAPMMQAAAPRVTDLTRQVLATPALIPALAPLRTLARALASEFRDPRLRQLFGRYATYVGGSPYRSPAVLALIWHAEASGVWAVKGGMHRLAQAMAGVAQAGGATFRLGTHVARIEMQRGRAAGVVLADGTRLAAGQVVFNGDPAALFHGHLGDAVRGAVPKPAVTPRSLSAAVWSFAATPRGTDLDHHNVFFGDDPRAEFGPIEAGRLPDDPTLYICAQDRGAGHRPTGPERFEIIMNAPPGLADSDKEREICRIRTFERLERLGLTFCEEPSPAALTTPADFDRLFPASQGSLYGRTPHGLMAPFQRPTARSRIPGLYLCGGGTHPGAGVPMATLSGRHAAAAILTDRTSTLPSRPTAMRGGMSTA